MKKVLFILILSLLNVQASNWIQYQIDGQGDRYFADKTTIRKKGNGIFELWIKIILKREKMIYGKYYSYELQKIFLSCNAETYGTRIVLFYNKRGDIVYNSGNLYGNYMPVVPGSTGATLFNAICYGKK